MSDPRILIAGIGNIFLGDDAFGVEVAQKMALRALPQGVRVVDFGIRALDLTYALLDECDIAIIVDAVPRGEAPGTLFVIEPEPISEDQNAAADLAAGSLLIGEFSSLDANPPRAIRLKKCRWK
jgi:hydrogenase maturation protease